MKLFIIFFTLLTAGLSFIIGRFFTTSLPMSANGARVFWILHTLATLSVLSAPFIYRLYPIKNPPLWYSSLQWSGYFFFGLYSVFIIFVLISDTSFGLYSRFSEVSEERRQFIKSTLAFFTLAAGSIVSGVGFFEATKKPEVKKVTVPIADLPSEFEGFTIVQLSDVHVGQTIRGDFVDTIVGVTNDLKADLVVLTGDLIDGSPAQLADELKSFARLQSTHGTLMIPGNHEYYWDLESWLAFWKQMGVKTLTNQHSVIEKNNKHLVVAGVHDFSANRVSTRYNSNPLESLHGAPANAVKILLAHQPRSVYAAAKAGFDLQLSGHTHSGQYFPYNIIIYLFQPFVKGLNKFEKTWIYVNQGTGYWGPPTRLGVPPEITHITLTKAVGA